MKKRHFLSLLSFLALGLITTGTITNNLVEAQNNNVLTSSDAKAEYDIVSKTLVLSTSKVKREIKFVDGKFVTTSLIDLVSNTSYLANNGQQREFTFVVNGTECSSDSTSFGNWKYVKDESKVLSQGELEYTLTLQNENVKVEKTYVIYPQTSIIQEWYEVTNISSSTMRISMPSIFEKEICVEGEKTDFYYMTGNGNYSGASILKNIPLNEKYERLFYSQDPYELQTVHGFTQDNIANYFMGVGIYNLFFGLHNRETQNGMFVLFDYIGVWHNDVKYENNRITYDGRVYMDDKAINAGDSFVTPKNLTGFWNGDIDEMGNTLGNYQAVYKWDYTSEQDYTSRQAQWIPGRQTDNAFEMAQNGRQIGISSVHIDDSWFDAAGDWNETNDDDFALINEFIKKTGGPGMTVWSPIWQTYYQAEIIKQNPDWVVEANDHGGWIGSNGGYGSHLNFAREDVYQFALNKLTAMQQEWGSYMWRYDAEAVSFSDGFNDMLQQSNNFYRLLQEFKDKNPNAGIHGCSSGGHSMSIESIRYSDMQQITDGGVGDVSGYYLSLLFPTVKLQGCAGGLNHYDPWFRSQLPYSGVASNYSPFELIPDDLASEEELEVVRQWNEMNEYLKIKGVKSRYSKYYRPLADGNIGKEYFFQQMNNDCTKGAIYITRYNEMVGKSLTIYPKGLVEDEYYTISSWEGGVKKVKKTGRTLMEEGITITSLVPGETIFFNLEDRPGNGNDFVNPSRPSNLSIKEAEYLDRKGIEINWKASSDNVMVSHYKIYCNDEYVDKVAYGTFYFGQTGNIYDTWGVSAVDGDGNESRIVSIHSGLKPNEDLYNFTRDFDKDGSRGWKVYESELSSQNEMTWNNGGNYLKGVSSIVKNDTLILGSSNTVIEWSAPRAGYISISGEIRKYRGLLKGNGIDVTLKHNDNILYSSFLDKDNFNGITYNDELYINAGDKIKFVFSSKNDITNDKVLFDSNIEYITNDKYKAIESIEVPSSSLVIAIGEEITIPMKVSPKDANTDELRYEIIDNNNLVSINERGQIKGLKTGETTIRVSSIYDEDLKAEIKVNIYDEKYTFNSARDYSATQGYKNWEYVEFPANNPNNYSYLQFDNLSKTWNGADPYTIISHNSFHPGSSNNTAQVFNAPYDGKIKTTLLIKKESPAGDGIDIVLYKNGQPWITYGFSTANQSFLKFDLREISVAKGDRLTFAIDCKKGNAFDSCSMEVNIDYVECTYEHSLEELQLTTSTGSNYLCIGESLTLSSIVKPNDYITKIKYSIISGKENVIFDEEELTVKGVNEGITVIQAMANDSLTTSSNIVLHIVEQEGIEVHNSSKDFSLTQGLNNWYYYYSEANGNKVLLNTNNGEAWCGRSWIRIGKIAMHPQIGADSVRAYKVPTTGKLQLLGTVAKDTKSLGGDGVSASLYLNNQLLKNFVIQPSDSKGYSYDLTIDANEGDMIYLQVNALGNDSFDSVNWMHVNKYLNSEITPYKITSFMELINEKVSQRNNTLQYVADIELLMDYYTKLSIKEKSLVDNYSYLLYGYEQAKLIKENYEKANEVNLFIDYAIVLNNLEFTNFVFAMYESLTQDQKSLVDNIDVLKSLYTNLLMKQNIVEIENRINTFDSDLITSKDYDNLLEIKYMIEELSSEEQTLISQESIEKLQEMLNKAQG